MKKHYIIPIFIPHYGCPHQCIFCNQKKITGISTFVTPEQVAATLQEHLSMISGSRTVEAAFYGGSFTALEPGVQEKLLRPAIEALHAGRIHAIRLSTRPDCIDEKISQRLAGWGVSTVELGVQSLDNVVLGLSCRGHSAEDVPTAMRALKKVNIKTGLQLMVGLPGQNWVSIINTATAVVQLQPDFVRIYPVLVIADTPLAHIYQQGHYRPLSLPEAVSRAAYLRLLFKRSHIPVIRLGLQATPELSDPENMLAGPYHPAFGEMVDAYLFYIMVARFLEFTGQRIMNLRIHHHPQDHSKLRGIKMANVRAWQEEYGVQNICWLSDGERRGQIVIEKDGVCYVSNLDMIFCT